MKDNLINIIQSSFSPEQLLVCHEMIKNGIALSVFSKIDLIEIMSEYEKKEIEIEKSLQVQLEFLKANRNKSSIF